MNTQTSPDALQMIMEAIGKMNEGQQVNFIEAIKELKRPDPEVEEQREAEKARAQERRRQRVAEQMAEAESREQKQKRCSHHNERGRTMVGSLSNPGLGQLHSDGFYHPRCMICDKEFDPIPVSRETAAGLV